MKLSSILLTTLLTLSPALAGNAEWWIDFGRSEFANTYTTPQKIYATRTTEAGWNNVSVSAAEQTAAGAASLNSSYFAETVETDSNSVVPTYAQQAVSSVSIYDTGNNANSTLNLSISKDTGIGTLAVKTSAGAPTDELFGATPRPAWVPTRAYGDFIMTYLNENGSGAFTLTLSGFEAGFYDFTVIAGGNSSMGSVYHLPVSVTDIPAALRTLNEQGYTCLCGHLKGSEVLPPRTDRMALLVGNEGNGVTPAAAALCYPYRLPMPGRAESLNAAVFGAIMLYELTSE